MKTSFSVDWLSITLPYGNENSFFPQFNFGFPPDAWSGGKGLHGYTQCIKHPYGIMVMSNSNRPEMGTHMVLSGRALSEIAKHNITGLSLAKWAIDHGCKITRMDLAIDVKEQYISPDELFYAPRLKVSTGKPKQENFNKGKERGFTIYVGSRSSEKFMRVYDKAAEQGLPDDVLWTRFELELKGDAALSAARTLFGMKTKQAAVYASKLMRGFWLVDHPLYDQIMGSDKDYVAGSKDTQHDTLNWLMGQVARSMAKTILELKHVDIMDAFAQRVQEEIDKIQAGG